MRRLALPLIGLALILGACTSSVVDETVTPPAESAAPFSGTQTGIDAEKSHVSFTGKSNIVNHEGKFTAFTVNMSLDPDAPADLTKAELAMAIDITSVKTDSEGLDKHLQREDFFDAANHPLATFTSTAFVAKGGNAFEITGNLSIKGVTKDATFRAQISDDRLVATYDLPREDFGVGNEAYGQKLLEKLVPVEVELVFVQ